MIINMTQEIKNFDGTALLGPDGLASSEVIAKLATLGASIMPKDLANAVLAVSVPLTLRSACCGALMGVYKDETDLPGHEKVRRYCIARKIYEEQSPDLPAEDIALVKSLVSKRFYASVVGPVWQLLEGK